MVYAIVGTPISAVLLWQCFQSRAVRQDARHLTQATHSNVTVTVRLLSTCLAGLKQAQQIEQSMQIDTESLADESMDVYKTDEYELKRSPWNAA